MAAPRGNKNAVGKGRPPKEGFSEAEVIALGEEMFKWMDECDLKKTQVVHLSEWYSHIKYIRPCEWDALQKRSCFLPYYERAIKWMGNRLLKNTKLPPVYGSRFLGIYFKDVREHEKQQIRDKVDYELERKTPKDESEVNLATILKMFLEGKITQKDVDNITKVASE